MNPYRRNSFPPPARPEPFDSEAYEDQLRRYKWAEQRRETFRGVLKIIGFGLLGAVFIVTLTGLLANSIEADAKCKDKGGVMVDGRCLKEIR